MKFKMLIDCCRCSKSETIGGNVDTQIYFILEAAGWRGRNNDIKDWYCPDCDEAFKALKEANEQAIVDFWENK